MMTEGKEVSENAYRFKQKWDRVEKNLLTDIWFFS